VLWRLNGTTTTRLTPFVAGGAGYIRELHEGALLVDTGIYAQVGGGVMWLLSSPASGVPIGLRIDGRALVRRKGAAFDTSLHAAPLGGVSVFVRF
jgi:hypothetical protein